MIRTWVSGMLRKRGAGEREGGRRPVGMPEAVAPAPTPWPLAPFVAMVLCGGFLILQLWPATHHRHPLDPSRTWIPRDQVVSGAEQYVQARAQPQWNWEEEEVQRAADLKARGQAVHVFMSTDEPDLRPIAVLINSTVVHARHPERLVFHLVVPPSQHSWFKLKAFFPDVSIEISRKPFDFERIRNKITINGDSKTREELTSPYNFVPFYLPKIYDGVGRLVYLDTDIVVQGDIEELATLDLHGHALAAVEDCMQHFEIYFNFTMLEEIRARDAHKFSWLPKEAYDTSTCVFNRGVMVVDTAEWKKQKLTEAIEWWMNEYAKHDSPLYSYGLSQPPFLLAVYRSYRKLDVTWNTRGLGRHELSNLERDYMEKLGLRRPKRSPFISPHADFAKILHFNGKFKPWKRQRIRLPEDETISLCGHKECADIWWSYLSPTANDMLKPEETST